MGGSPPLPAPPPRARWLVPAALAGGVVIGALGFAGVSYLRKDTTRHVSDENPSKEECRALSDALADGYAPLRRDAPDTSPRTFESIARLVDHVPIRSYELLKLAKRISKDARGAAIDLREAAPPVYGHANQDERKRHLDGADTKLDDVMKASLEIDDMCGTTLALPAPSAFFSPPAAPTPEAGITQAPEVGHHIPTARTPIGPPAPSFHPPPF